MAHRFPADGLLAPEFSERLRELLVRARAALGLEALAVFEIAALAGQMAPWWRMTEPEVLPTPSCSGELFLRLVEQSRAEASRAHEELAGPFAGRQVSVFALNVQPRVSAGEDALLVCAFGAAGVDVAALSELRLCLELGLSEDRKDRLARTLFLAVEQGPDPMELTDTHARLFYANAAWEQTFGHRARDVVGQTVGSLLRDPVDSLHNPAFYQFTLATLAQGKTWLGSLACRSADGKRRFVEANVGPFFAEKHGFVGNFAVRRDTAHRLERDQALAVSHREFRNVLSAVPDGVVVLRGDCIYFANPAFLTMVGLPEVEVIGCPYVTLVHPDDRVQFEAEYQSKMTRVRILGENGATRFAEISPAGAVSFEATPALILLSRDITDHRIAQEQLAHSDKLSALGSLAAGVAHEINNPLAYLALNLREIRARSGQRSAEETELLDEAIDGARRIQRIVTELHGFSAADASNPLEAVEVAKAIASATNIALNQIRHRAKLEREHEAGLFALAREGQLVQVLLNVLVNAAQAIPMKGDIERHAIRIRSYSLNEARVRISVTDTGKGIAKDALPKVFEPFLTSKPRGEGAGLGLAISKRILDELHGEIHITSRHGKGTTVTIDLPRAQPVTVAPSVSGVRPSVTGVPARILIVDDELFLAKSLRRALAPHQAIIAGDGVSAVALLEKDANFDVILCDLMMPGLSGPQLHTRVRARRPELADRFVFMTGGTFTEASRAFVQSVGLQVLYKPFDLVKVLECVEATMAKRQAEQARSRSLP